MNTNNEEVIYYAYDRHNCYMQRGGLEAFNVYTVILSEFKLPRRVEHHGCLFRYLPDYFARMKIGTVIRGGLMFRDPRPVKGDFIFVGSGYTRLPIIVRPMAKSIGKKWYTVRHVGTGKLVHFIKGFAFPIKS